ncbi:MAG: heme ABC exporter ATP-binding protein CcmA [candidate division KSB1 bacterium]|jgi:heme exporter protein A|nr:heme ABC exporter ATP-binding protein CcmA [candidate division KSB1 bacterium]
MSVQTPAYSLELKNVAKHFGRTLLFKKVNFHLHPGEIIAVTGWNGSGKSTLLRIIAGLIRPSAGKVNLLKSGVPAGSDGRRKFTGMVSPALALYDELSAVENLNFLARVRGADITEQEILDMISAVGLQGWEHALYGIYSSGMKQRLKMAQALLHKPPLLLLDEPFSNLDSKGISRFDSLISERRRAGMIIIASNEQREIEYGDRIVNLSE